jgi:hypothetical protein
MNDKLSSAMIVAEFVRGRPALELRMRRKMTDGFTAPEVYPVKAQQLVIDAMQEVTDEERRGLDRMRGNGPVLWDEVAKLFGALL